MSLRNHAAALGWRYGRRVRWVLAACCLLVAVATASGSGERGQVRAVPVAASDLVAGQRISAADVATAQTDLSLDTPAPAELVGEMVRGPVAAGEPLTRSRLVPGRSVAAPAGAVVFPLAIADERIAGLLDTGDRVDVLVAPDTMHAAAPRVAARDVEVLAVPEPDDAGPVSPQSGAVVLLALDDTQAQELAGLRRTDHVTVAIR